MAQQREAERRPSTLQGWRAAVHDYVKSVNEAEIDMSTGPLLAVLSDASHLARAAARLSRMREREDARGAFPGRHEARARLLDVREDGPVVTIRLQLHLKRSLSLAKAAYTEEKLEVERIRLEQRGGVWRIASVRPEIAERRPDGRKAEYDNDREGAGSAPRQTLHPGGEGRGPLPYINEELLPHFRKLRAGVPYRRDLAAAYADRWWNEPNPAYENFEVNCTNYVSQCLFAGHAPMHYTGRRESGWWYKGRSGGRELWSYSWAVSHALQSYLAGSPPSGLQAVQVASPGDLKLGDVIVYDWDGNGRYQHSTIVTAFDHAGMPLVNAHTTASRHRYWDYRDSYAWTERTRYKFLHISDEF